MSPLKSASKWLGGCLALLLMAAGPAFAQTGTITGTVTDATTGQPLVGAQVVVVGTNLSVPTNQSGRFLIPGVAAGERQVRASMIGYGAKTFTVTVTAGATAVQDFALEMSAIELEGLVVNAATGREQRRREVGNSVGTVNVDNVQLAPITNTAQLLQGKVAGATILQSSGMTGTGARVRIRGANSISLSNAPLIVIDGVRVESSESSLGFGVGGQTPSRLNDINPADIETIEVLKGPAASALYGTAAANGVIQITTKRGRAGQADFRIWTEYGTLKQATTFPDNVIAVGNLVVRDSTGNVVSNGVGRCDIIRRAIGNNPTGNEVGCTGVTDTYRFNPLENPETSPLRDGLRRSTGVSISGGNDGLTYYISGGFDNESGVLPDNKLERIRVQANTRGQFGEKLAVTSTISYLNSDLQLPQSDNALYGLTGMALSGSALPSNVENFQGYADDIKFFYDWKTFQRYSRIQGAINADYRPATWLSVNGTVGLDRYAREEVNRLPRVTAYTVFGGVYTNGFIQNYNYDIWDLTANGSATATFNLSPDVISTTSVGTQYLREHLHQVYAFGASLSPGVEESLAGATSDYDASEANTLNATIAAFVQQQFAWRDRLFVSGALRGDQNTAFGMNTEWIWYPSVSASWVVSEESFFPELPGLNNLRLRAAYGQSGLRPGPTDAIQSFATAVTRAGGADAPGIAFSGIGNPDLRPERSSEWEFGFETDFLQGRLGVEATYFSKKSTDELVSKPLPPSIGSASSRYENIGRVDNSGFELGLNTQPVRNENLVWNLNLSGSFIKNELVDLGTDARGEPIPDIVFGLGSTQRHKEGYPLGSYFHYPISYNDANGDGLLSPSEVQVRTDTVVYLGSPMPKREMNLTTDIQIRDWVRVGALIDYKGGHKLLNGLRAWRCATNRDFNCEALYDENTPLDQQAASVAQSVYSNTYTGFVEDADFVKLRELSVTFMVPRDFTSQFGLKGLSLTLAGRNLKTWTDYSGLDPELNYAGQSNFTAAEFYTLPPSRYFTVRFDANF